MPLSRSKMEGVVCSHLAQEVIRHAPEVDVVTTSDALADVLGQPTERQRQRDIRIGSFKETAVVDVPEIGLVVVEQDHHMEDSLLHRALSFVIEMAQPGQEHSIRGHQFDVTVLPSAETAQSIPAERRASFTDREFWPVDFWTVPGQQVDALPALEVVRILDAAIAHLKTTTQQA